MFIKLTEDVFFWSILSLNVTIQFDKSAIIKDNKTRTGMMAKQLKLSKLRISLHMKFTSSFPNSRYDWQRRNEIAKFVANFGDFEQTKETVCEKFVKHTVKL